MILPKKQESKKATSRIQAVQINTLTKELVPKMEGFIDQKTSMQAFACHHMPHATQQHQTTMLAKSSAMPALRSHPLLAVKQSQYHGVPLLLYDPISHTSAPVYSSRSQLWPAFSNKELQQMGSANLLWHHTNNLALTCGYWNFPTRPCQ